METIRPAKSEAPGSCRGCYYAEMKAGQDDKQNCMKWDLTRKACYCRNDEIYKLEDNPLSERIDAVIATGASYVYWYIIYIYFAFRKTFRKR